MKIIFANRRDCLTNRGGDTVQMLLTMEYLLKHDDITIEICLDPSELANKHFDILHVFNIQTYDESNQFIQVALELKIPVVLTPVYWNFNFSNAYYIFTRLHINKPLQITPFLSNILRNLTNPFIQEGYLSTGYKKHINCILSKVDLLLPNSPEELELIKNHFDFIPKNPPMVVPNAIEFNEEPEPPLPEKDPDLMLQVGRISPVKNQAATILAMKKMKSKKLLLVGRVENLNYFKYVQRLAQKQGGVSFVDEIIYSQLEEYYRKAFVHILPSFRESPGLASLEALLKGCEIVISDKMYGPVDYYQFTRLGHLCNPFDGRSISSAIEDSFLNLKNNPEERKKYFQFLNYQTVADLTFKAYLSLSA